MGERCTVEGTVQTVIFQNEENGYTVLSLAVDGQDISVTADLMAIRRQHAIGDTIVLTVLRDDQTLDIPVVLRSNKK